ncbi:MAG: cation-transporting P-type ATPase, partial [Desulfobacterales bacterium]|nr:cation-transporting P-type ATPase [Desulfobacterales bacterium]
MIQKSDLLTSSDKEIAPGWYTLSCEAVFSKLKSSPLGLTHAEASKRLAEFGLNELQAARRISPWRILLEQFKNILILILIAATV